MLSTRPAPPVGSTASKPFLSLRTRLMLALSVAFLLLFLLLFAVLLRAFEAMQLNQARADLAHAVQVVARDVNGDEVARLYQPDGSLKPDYWKDPLYLKNFGGLASRRDTDPRVFPYAYIRQGERFELVASPDGRKAMMLATSEALATGLRDTTLSSEVVQRDGYYLSGTVPVRDSSGKVVCAMGVDLRIDGLYNAFVEVRQHSWQVLLGLYLTLLLLFVLIASRFLRPVSQLAQEMGSIQSGQYQRDLNHLRSSRYRDEVSTLSEVFEDLLARVAQREQVLVQQLAELRIEVDQVKKASQVAEITGSEGFLELREKARQLRERRR